MSVGGLNRGTVVGQYRIIRRIGAGGMGIVYEAFEEGLNRRVALKMIHEEAMKDSEAIRRFELEGRALARVNHPHVVTVYNLGRYNDVPYLAMEYVEGTSLRDYLFKRVFPEKEALPLFRQLLQGVEVLHKNGVLHRDLKPHNIIYQPNSEIKIVDFGIAKLILNTEDEITGAGMIVGSAKYISPEGAQGSQVTIQSDVWGLGVLFYQMLVGETPFEARTYHEVLEKVRGAEIHFPIFSKLFIHGELRSIVLRMLQRPLEKRYINTNLVLQDIDKFLVRIGGDPNFKPNYQQDNSPNLNIKNQEELFVRLKESGFDTFRTKMILTMALNEQAKIEIKNWVKLEETLTVTAKNDITISDQALNAAIQLLESAKSKEVRNDNQERRARPRVKKKKINAKYAAAIAAGVLLVSTLIFYKTRTPHNASLTQQRFITSEPVYITDLPKSKDIEAKNERLREEQEAVRLEKIAKKHANEAYEAQLAREVDAAQDAADSAKQAEFTKRVEAIRKAERLRKVERVESEKLAKAAKIKAAAAEARGLENAKRLAMIRKAEAAKKAAARQLSSVSKKIELPKVDLPVPDIKSPLDGTTVTSSPRSPSSIFFFWKEQENVSSSEIEYSLSQDFSSTLLSQQVRSNQFNLEKNLPYGSVYWRVRAKQGASTSSWSRARSLVISAPE